MVKKCVYLERSEGRHSDDIFCTVIILLRPIVNVT